MNFEPDRVLRTADRELSAHLPERGWACGLPILVATLLAILAIYRDTAKSIVAIWASSETFTHGYLIVPMTLALVWIKRREVAALAPRPDVLGFALLAGAGFTWLAAEAAQVQVLMQYALVAMVPAAVLALAGRRVAWALAFPLAFLLLAVPFGEALLPRLMEWTADFTVTALRITGIPVYREGTFFTIPSGHWSVAEACSGLRYLIASITISAVYAYLTYRTWWRRALFLAASVAVPIGANCVRAYLIVMIGHVSSMRLAVGVDHFIYGWLFFGFVIGLLFWIGSFWLEAPAPVRHQNASLDAAPTPTLAMSAAALAAATVVAAWPLCAPYLDDEVDGAPLHLAPPRGASGWALERQHDMHWLPHYNGAAGSTLGVYRKGDRSVGVYLGYYRNQRQGAELVSSQNQVAGGADSQWSTTTSAIHDEPLAEGMIELRESRLRSGAGGLLVWDWYRIDGRDLSNPFLAKALLARDKLLGRGDESAVIVLAAPYDAHPQAAADTLRLFLHDMLPSIDNSLALSGQGSVR